jgi:DNA-binding LacI/PurR family transcriptional regulator
MEYDPLPSDDFIHLFNFKVDGGEAAIDGLLQLAYRPTAVLAADDLTNIGVLHTDSWISLKVPDDISIRGFDDIDFCLTTRPPLTTIRPSLHELADKAYDAFC